MQESLSIVLATRNPGKVAEIRDLLGGLPVRLLSTDDLDAPPAVEEDEPTLRGNARKKAMAFHQHTGQPALADDTGLEVEALKGAPGVHTARAKLLRELDGAETRRARFRTVVAVVDETGVHYFEGVCAGRIADAPRGDKGFGYDPLFIPDGEQRTFAEMDPAEKNAISHRKQALHQFATFLRERLERRKRV